MKKIIVFGTGDISQIAHFYLSELYDICVSAFTVDREFIKDTSFCGLSVIPFEEVESIFPPNDYHMFIPLPYTKVNQLRALKYHQAKAKGYNFISYLSPKATIASNVKIGENCFIFEDNTIQPFVKIGDNCILWSGNHIGHHSKIENHCFLASHVVVSGGVTVGECSFIGVNATLRDHIKIGKSNVIGAGSIILGDTEDNTVYMAKPTDPSRVPSNRLRGI